MATVSPQHVPILAGGYVGILILAIIGLALLNASADL